MNAPQKPPDDDHFLNSLRSGFGRTLGRLAALALVGGIGVAGMALYFDVTFKAALLTGLGIVIALVVLSVILDSL